jgi:hypothetical protein
VTVDSPTGRTLLLRVHAAKPPGVLRDGANLQEIAAGTLDGAAEGWKFDTVTGMVLVKFNHGGGSTRVTF